MKQILAELQSQVPISDQVDEIRREYATGQYKCLLLHLFSGVPDEAPLVTMARDLKQCLNTPLIVGTMSAGEIRDAKLMPTGVLLSAMLFEESDVHILRYDDAKGREAEIGIKIREDLNAIPSIRGAELLFPGTEMDTQQMFAEISLCRKDIHIFGGYPGGHKLNSPEHFIFNAEGVMYNSILVITYAGANLHIDMDKSIGWVPLGMPFKITRAEGKHLIELDHKPAAEVYEKFLQIDRKLHNNAEEAFEFPLIARQNGEDRLRSVVHIEEDGSLWLHGFVTEGMDIHLTYGDPSNIVETVNRRLDAMRRFQPQAILLYSCVVRKTFWENFVDMEMEPFAKICPTAGFHTWGEILRNMKTGELGENNITLLSIGMREGEPQGEPLPPLRIDDTVLQGQASVLRRLTRLVYSTMSELQKAQRQLTLMAEHDALTGLYNRGKIEGLIDDAMETELISLVMVDVDFFKRVNDTHGHDVGDITLKEIAGILENSVTSYADASVGRWGGEEFFVLLPGIDEEQVMSYAEYLRRAVDMHIFPTVGHLTISQGVMTVRRSTDHKRVYTQIDNALYKAKTSGRNRVVQAPSEP